MSGVEPRAARPSPGRRVVLFAPVRIVIGVLAVASPAALVQIAARAAGVTRTGPASALSPLVALAVAGAALVGYLGFVRWVERRAVGELASEGAFRGLAAGTGLGIAVMGLTTAAMFAGGAYDVAAGNRLVALLGPLGLAVASGFFEELLFRGVIFRVTEGALGTWLALAITSALFGAAHLSNDNASAWSGIAIALEAGVLLGAAFVAARSLWLPIGLHVGWNFAEAGLIGAPVSGTSVKGLVTARLEGPEWLTGGSFGPEGSVPAVAICLAIAAALLVIAGRNDRLLSPPWRLRTAGPAAAGDAPTGTV